MYNLGPNDPRSVQRTRPPDLPPIPPRRPARARLVLIATIVGITAVAAAPHLIPREPLPPSQASERRALSASDAGATPASRSPTARPGGYHLLPLTETQIDSAARTAASFTAAYATYSYAERAAGYASRLRPYTAPGLLAVLAQQAATPGLQRRRAEQHASATATATVTAIRDVAGTTLTFLITASQATRSQGRTGSATARYAVTIASGGGRWEVFDIEPASAGQSGSTP